ncbi:MAG: sigma-70 family RNA polymerase sigma factor [Acutalibacteraceae bacterium]
MSIDFVENYENLSDEEIVSLINGGDFELLQVIIERYLPQIHFYADKYCAQSEREDAVQEATYALYSAVKNYDMQKSSFSTFAALCIKRSVITSAKRLKSRKKIPDELLSPIDEVEITDSNSPEKIFFDRESYKTLTDSIRLELSGLEYSVLQLFLSGKRYIEIANVLGISEKSVNNALLRIRKKLKK